MTIKICDKCVQVEVFFDPVDSNVTVYVDKFPACAAHITRNGTSLQIDRLENCLASTSGQVLLTKTDDEIERDAAMYHAATGRPAPSIQSEDP